jgi:hypothetical protein
VVPPRGYKAADPQTNRRPPHGATDQSPALGIGKKGGRDAPAPGCEQCRERRENSGKAGDSRGRRGGQVRRPRRECRSQSGGDDLKTQSHDESKSRHESESHVQSESDVESESHVESKSDGESESYVESEINDESESNDETKGQAPVKLKAKASTPWCGGLRSGPLTCRSAGVARGRTSESGGQAALTARQAITLASQNRPGVDVERPRLLDPVGDGDI